MTRDISDIPAIKELSGIKVLTYYTNVKDSCLYIHFTSDDKESLIKIVKAATTSNNQVLIQYDGFRDATGFYYTCILKNNLDIFLLDLKV